MEDTISFQRIVFKRINRHNVFRNRLTFHAQNHQILFFFKKSGKGEFRFRTNQHICSLLALSQSERVNLYYFRLNMYFTKLTIVKVMVAQAQVCWLVENEMPCVFLNHYHIIEYSWSNLFMYSTQYHHKHSSVAGWTWNYKHKDDFK
jgi:hypothetical protein